MIDKIQYGSHPVVCAKGRRPEYPGAHFILNPKGSGLVLTEAVDGLGPKFNPVVGKPVSKLDHQLKNLRHPRVIIDPIDLNPDTICPALLSLLRRLPYTNRSHIIVFWINDPGEMYEDPTLLAMQRWLDRGKPKPTVLAYWPELPKSVFAEIFGYLHPDYSFEEARIDAQEIAEQAIEAVKELNTRRARELLTEIDELLGRGY